MKMGNKPTRPAQPGGGGAAGAAASPLQRPQQQSEEQQQRQQAAHEQQAYSDAPLKAKVNDSYAEVAYLTGRSRVVCEHFASAIGVDDFMYRLEIALFAYGFNGDNAIAMVNLCRDEITVTLKHTIEQVFGSSFATNGLGGVLTCGVTGVAAGLSHAPVSKGSGKERYVFFSFPHVSVDARGTPGRISRPGRPGMSCACGALQKALIDIQSEGLSASCKIPGVHDPLDPEYTILKQRLARRLRYEGTSDASVDALSLIDLTKVAERTITDDLEYLIAHTVDPSKADYAVVTGVQVHNWGPKFDDDSPNLEFLAPTSVYVVVNGEKTYLDLNAMPSLTPRQVRLLTSGSERSERSGRGGEQDIVCNSGGNSTLREINPPYLYNTKAARRKLRERVESYGALLEDEGLRPANACTWPSWQSTMRAQEPFRAAGDNSVVIDHNFSSDDELDAIWSKLQDMYVSGSQGGGKYLEARSEEGRGGGDSGSESDDGGGDGGARPSGSMGVGRIFRRLLRLKAGGGGEEEAS